MISPFNKEYNKNIETVVLVDNDRLNDETKETLEGMFAALINHYKLKNLIAQVRYGRQDELAKLRIAELNEEIQKLNSFYIEAKQSSIDLRVNSELKISRD